MVNVDIDKELYEGVKRAVQKRKYNYPSIKFFVQKAIYNELINSKTYVDNDFNDFDELYSKLKESIRHNPKLRAKVDEIYNSEIKKIKRGILQ